MVLDDGACNKLGEERDIQCQLQKTAGHLFPFPVDVDDVGKPLEGEKGNAHRQGNACQWDFQGKYLVDRGEKKVRVFKDAQHAQVQSDRACYHQLVPSRMHPLW